MASGYLSLLVFAISSHLVQLVSKTEIHMGSICNKILKQERPQIKLDGDRSPLAIEPTRLLPQGGNEKETEVFYHCRSSQGIGWSVASTMACF